MIVLDLGLWFGWFGLNRGLVRPDWSWAVWFKCGYGFRANSKPTRGLGHLGLISVCMKMGFLENGPRPKYVGHGLKVTCGLALDLKWAFCWASYVGLLLGCFSWVFIELLVYLLWIQRNFCVGLTCIVHVGLLCCWLLWAHFCDLHEGFCNRETKPEKRPKGTGI
jgi:hypothetical protein